MDEPRVPDFGLAKRLDNIASLTGPGELVDRPRYMAAEHAEGKKAENTTAADVYGLGAARYSLLTTQQPVDGESPLGILRHGSENDVEPLRPQLPQVSRNLARFWLNCLWNELNKRYPSATALADDTGALAAGPADSSSVDLRCSVLAVVKA
jgi:serine/threonine-protein kinase